MKPQRFEFSIQCLFFRKFKYSGFALTTGFFNSILMEIFCFTIVILNRIFCFTTAFCNGIIDMKENIMPLKNSVAVFEQNMCNQFLKCVSFKHFKLLFRKRRNFRDSCQFVFFLLNKNNYKLTAIAEISSLSEQRYEMFKRNTL